jgi:hypothetical protein
MTQSKQTRALAKKILYEQKEFRIKKGIFELSFLQNELIIESSSTVTNTVVLIYKKSKPTVDDLVEALTFVHKYYDANSYPYVYVDSSEIRLIRVDCPVLVPFSVGLTQNQLTKCKDMLEQGMHYWWERYKYALYLPDRTLNNQTKKLVYTVCDEHKRDSFGLCEFYPENSYVCFQPTNDSYSYRFNTTNIGLLKLQRLLTHPLINVFKERAMSIDGIRFILGHEYTLLKLFVNGRYVRSTKSLQVILNEFDRQIKKYFFPICKTASRRKNMEAV